MDEYPYRHYHQQQEGKLRSEPERRNIRPLIFGIIGGVVILILAFLIIFLWMYFLMGLMLVSFIVSLITLIGAKNASHQSFMFWVTGTVVSLVICCGAAVFLFTLTQGISSVAALAVLAIYLLVALGAPSRRRS